MDQKQSVFIFFILCFFQNMVLSETQDITFSTIYRDDRVFETTGSVFIRGTVDGLNAALSDYNNYNAWLLQGLDQKGEQRGKLPALLVDLSVDDQPAPDTIHVMYDLNKFIKLRGLSAPFKVVSLPGESGLLGSLTFIYIGKKNHLREGRYRLYFTESSDGVLINFICEARLSGFLDLFINTRSYDKNIGYYITGFYINLQNKIDSESQ